MLQMSGNIIYLKIHVSYLNLCNKSYNSAIIRSHTIHLQRKIFYFWKFIQIYKYFWSQAEMSGICLKNVRDPRSQDPAFYKLWSSGLSYLNQIWQKAHHVSSKKQGLCQDSESLTTNNNIYKSKANTFGI